MRLIESYLLTLFFAFLACFPVFSQGTVASEGHASEIRFESQRIDLGETLYKNDSTYVYLFPYENTGSAPLIVNKVVGHCPCVTVDYSTDPLPPGGRDTLSVYFKPSHASKYTQRVTVFSNSVRSVVTLYAKGNFLNSSDWNNLAKSDPHE